MVADLLTFQARPEKVRISFLSPSTSIFFSLLLKLTEVPHLRWDVPISTFVSVGCESVEGRTPEVWFFKPDCAIGFRAPGSGFDLTLWDASLGMGGGVHGEFGRVMVRV